MWDKRAAAAQRGENNLNTFNDVRTENGSSQGQNLALTGLCGPSSLDSGLLKIALEMAQAKASM